MYYKMFFNTNVKTDVGYGVCNLDLILLAMGYYIKNLTTMKHGLTCINSLNYQQQCNVYGVYLRTGNTLKHHHSNCLSPKSPNAS